MISIEGGQYMPMLIRHTACESPKPLWQNLLFIIGIVFGLSFLVQIINLLPPKLDAVASLAILVVAARLCSYIINRKLAKYNYLLIDNQLIIQKQIGKRENTVLVVETSDIERIKPIKEFIKEKRYKKSYYLACRLRGEDVYSCEYAKNNKSYRLIFQPNEVLLKELIKLTKIKK